MYDFILVCKCCILFIISFVRFAKKVRSGAIFGGYLFCFTSGWMQAKSPGNLSRKRVVPEVYGGPIPASAVAPGAGEVRIRCAKNYMFSKGGVYRPKSEHQHLHKEASHSCCPKCCVLTFLCVT